MRVLMPLYFVPPLDVVASLRVRRLVGRLPGRGIEPVIVTPRAATWEVSGIRMVGFTGTDPLAAVHAARGVASGRSRLRPVKRWVRSFQVPDERWPLRRAWVAAALEAAGPGVDAVYSSSAPYTAHLVGRDLARKLDRPWVMELRDLWSDNTYQPQYHNPLSRIRNRRLERNCVREAAAVVVLTEAHRAHAAARYPEAAGKLHVVPNAFEPELPPRRPSGRTLRLLHAGNLYGGRSLAGLAAAVRAVERLPGFDAVVLEVAGRSFDMSWERALGGSLDRVVVHGPLPHARVRELLAEVHAGVLHNPASDRIHIPGKLYDYLGAAIPVLDLSRQPDIPGLCQGPVPYHRADGDDLPGLLAAVSEIGAWWNAHPAGVPRAGSDHPHSADAAARRLAGVLESVVR